MITFSFDCLFFCDDVVVVCALFGVQPSSVLAMAAPMWRLSRQWQAMTATMAARSTYTQLCRHVFHYEMGVASTESGGNIFRIDSQTHGNASISTAPPKQAIFFSCLLLLFFFVRRCLSNFDFPKNSFIFPFARLIFAAAYFSRCRRTFFFCSFYFSSFRIYFISFVSRVEFGLIKMMIYFSFFVWFFIRRSDKNK